MEMSVQGLRLTHGLHKCMQSEGSLATQSAVHKLLTQYNYSNTLQDRTQFFCGDTGTCALVIKYQHTKIQGGSIHIKHQLMSAHMHDAFT